MITEVQIVCIVLMGLITLFLVFSLPRYMSAGNLPNSARKLLAGGTFLITFHFFCQYVLHKEENNIEDVRTIINLLFGIPITYLINLSYLYLLRKGEIQKIEWIYGPAVLCFSILVYVVAQMGNDLKQTLPFANQITATLYGTVLIYYSILQFKDFLRIKRSLIFEEDILQRALLKWTKFSMFTMVLLSLGFPFMTFNSNLIMRSIYGILSISFAFFYILCFIGYCLNYHTKVTLSPENEEAGLEMKKSKETILKKEKAEMMNSISEKFIKSEYYLQAGITLKDVAEEMGISCNMLKVWLHSTEYEKFNNWINYLRIEKAKELLLKCPDFTSEEIAEQCGFCDRQYFQQIFKKKEGVSPSKWIKETINVKNEIKENKDNEIEKVEINKEDLDKDENEEKNLNKENSEEKNLD